MMKKHLQLACNNLANVISNTAPRLPPSPSMCNYHTQSQLSCQTYWYIIYISPALSLKLIPFWYSHLFIIKHILPPSKKPVSSRPSVSPSSSHKCLRFDLWLPLHTIKDFMYLLTYLLNDHSTRMY